MIYYGRNPFVNQVVCFERAARPETAALPRRNPFVNQVVCFPRSCNETKGYDKDVSQSLRESGRLFRKTL